MRRKSLFPLLSAVCLLTTLAAPGLIRVAARAVGPSDGERRAASPATPLPNAPAKPVRLIFIHHSTGGNWLADNWGGLGLALRDNNYFVSDTTYGWGPGAIGDRTDLGNWWEWFRDASHSPAYLSALYAESGQTNTFGSYSRLPANPGGENQIILFKSCFPNSNLSGPTDPPTGGSNPIDGKSVGDASYTVANAKGLYGDLLNYFATRQDKLFIVITAPPLVASATDASRAANARAFNNWLADPNGWLANYAYRNVAVYDYYNVLTGPDNHHRLNSSTGLIEHTTSANNTAYYPTGDSHPSAAGDQKATAELVPLLNLYYSRWMTSRTAGHWLFMPLAVR
jgi:hypothetical protein